MRTIPLVPGYLLSCSFHSSSYYLFSHHPIPSLSGHDPQLCLFQTPSISHILHSLTYFCAAPALFLLTNLTRVWCWPQQSVIPSLFFPSLFILLDFFMSDFVNFSGKAGAFLVANILSLCPILVFTFIFIFVLSHNGDFWVIYGLSFGSRDGSPLENPLATTQKCLWKFISHGAAPSKCPGLTFPDFLASCCEAPSYG